MYTLPDTPRKALQDKAIHVFPRLHAENLTEAGRWLDARHQRARAPTAAANSAVGFRLPSAAAEADAAEFSDQQR
ncbi:hypothetical protein [Mycobacterium camsae]|uniref:hypothetical protein n=1 Tax=Mycobacterium gordonae TaxID=1778 RepID=UPI00197EFC6D|nr:hypothetical protein [Mycobacterium gordonae]